MCEVLDKIVKEGEIEAYLDMNLTVSEIAQKVNLSVPEVEKLLLHYQTNKISEDTLSCRTKPLYDA